MSLSSQNKIKLTYVKNSKLSSSWESLFLLPANPKPQIYVLKSENVQTRPFFLFVVVRSWLRKVPGVDLSRVAANAENLLFKYAVLSYLRARRVSQIGQNPRLIEQNQGWRHSQGTMGATRYLFHTFNLRHCSSAI